MSFDRDMATARASAERFKARKGTPQLAASIPPDAVAWCERYLPFAMSEAWRVFVAALYGLAIGLELQGVLESISGFKQPVADGYLEAVVVAGRRGGKSAVTACLGVFMAVVEGAAHMRFLAPGQRGYVVVISRTQRQALEVFRYARSIAERNPEIAALLDGEPLESQAGGELRFVNGVVLTILPASKASVRGFTILGAVLDEYAWMATDEEAAHQDEEIASAVRYAMVAPKGAPGRRLLIISSPAAKSGLVYEAYARFFGKADAPILVAHGATWTWNPSVDREWLELERARDPKRFQREILAEFADAISAWCDAAVIDAAVGDRTADPLKPVIVPVHWRPTDGDGPTYYGAVDAAFKRDNFVLAIGHLDGTGAPHERKLVVDGVWKWKPQPGEPLDMREIVRQSATTCKEYGVADLVGDQFASIPLTGEFETHGIRFEEVTATQQSKLELFTRLREAFYLARVSLPNDETTLRELKELQERVTASGGVQIGHPNRATAHDDHAHAIAWLYGAAAKPRPFVGRILGDWMSPR